MHSSRQDKKGEVKSGQREGDIYGPCRQPHQLRAPGFSTFPLSMRGFTMIQKCMPPVVSWWGASIGWHQALGLVQHPIQRVLGTWEQGAVVVIEDLDDILFVHPSPHVVQRVAQDTVDWPKRPKRPKRKRAEMLRHPCILGGPQQRGQNQKSKPMLGVTMMLLVSQGMGL